ncbi:NACHT, LRR and PYD domains-containing protein 3-like isoform X2 [Amblyraja radiata]|nr:NACHT, LRR and PYD domains-containing protein 3-like isoform X2 [Amblyraja radiata]
MGASSAKPTQQGSFSAGPHGQSTRTRPTEGYRNHGPIPTEVGQSAGDRSGGLAQRPAPREDPWFRVAAPIELPGIHQNVSMNNPPSILRGADSAAAVSQLVTNLDDFKLFHLMTIYRNRLEKAMERGVHGISLALTSQGHFSEPEHRRVAELAGKGDRMDSSKLLLNLVMEKGSRTRRVMWETFVQIQNMDPMLIKILKEIGEAGFMQLPRLKMAGGSPEIGWALRDAQQKHRETLRVQTEKLNVSIVLRNGNVKVLQLIDKYAELTVISTVRDRKLVGHEMLAASQDHDDWREKSLPGISKKIQIDQLFQSSFFQNQDKSGISSALAGVAGVGKTTMVQKIVYNWATGKIFQQFQFVFRLNFRDLNLINCSLSLTDMILHQYPYLSNILEKLWENPEWLLFIFDGLDEFKDTAGFARSQEDTEPQRMCTDPNFSCEVSEIVFSLIQHKLLPGCSVLVTSRPTAIHLLEKAEISVWIEILGLVDGERKEYFNRLFEDRTVAAAVFKHVKENEILYTMSYNPSYCWILGLTLGPFFTQGHREQQQIPKTITQLYSRYIYDILRTHSCETESPRDVLHRVGQMALTAVSEKVIVFTDGDLIKYNLQPSQFLMKLLQRECSGWSVVYTFPHFSIQEFVAAIAQFLTPDSGDMMKFLSESYSTTDGRFEVFLRFVAGLSSPGSAGNLEEFLGPFPQETTCRVITWMMEVVKRQIGNTGSKAGKRSLLNTLHYLSESQNTALAQATLGSMETLSFRGVRLTLIDCEVLSHIIGLCDTIKHMDLRSCNIQCEGLQRLQCGLHLCQDLGLGNNKLGDSGVKVVSAALRKTDCKIQRLRLYNNGLKPSCAESLALALNANRSMTELDLGFNELGDSGLKLVFAALRNPDCKLQKLRMDGAGLTDSCTEDLASALSANCALTELKLGSNSFTDQSVPTLYRLILTHRNLDTIGLRWNMFTSDGENQLMSVREYRHRLSITI